MPTEKLKALSYAIAVQQIRGLAEPDPKAIEAYREIVGAGRDEASHHVMGKLGLESELRLMMEKYHVSEPGQVLTAMRKDIYSKMVADMDVLRNNQWPYTVDLLRVARETSCSTALATMSKREDTLRIVRALNLEKSLDLIISADDVKTGKPDPEIYLTAAKKLAVPASECLVLEDSVNGVRAGLAAGMNVVAIATPFTNAGLHTSQIIDDVWIVHEPERLAEVVKYRIEDHNRIAHRSELKT